MIHFKLGNLLHGDCDDLDGGKVGRKGWVVLGWRENCYYQKKDIATGLFWYKTPHYLPTPAASAGNWLGLTYLFNSTRGYQKSQRTQQRKTYGLLTYILSVSVSVRLAGWLDTRNSQAVVLGKCSFLILNYVPSSTSVSGFTVCTQYLLTFLQVQPTDHCTINYKQDGFLQHFNIYTGRQNVRCISPRKKISHSTWQNTTLLSCCSQALLLVYY